GLAAEKVSALAEDDFGNIWAGTHEGALWRLSKGVWNEQASPWKPHVIAAIAPGTNGSVWVATEGGLYRMGPELSPQVERIKGLPSDSIRTLYWEGPESIWIGTGDRGLVHWRHGIISSFTTREGMPDNTISQILEDGSGRLWLGGKRGIACVSERELDELVAGKIASLYPQVYGLAEGMPAEECTSGFWPAGLKSQSGLLWFSTVNGVVVIDPRQNTPHPGNALVVLEEILVDGVPVA